MVPITPKEWADHLNNLITQLTPFNTLFLISASLRKAIEAVDIIDFAAHILEHLRCSIRVHVLFVKVRLLTSIRRVTLILRAEVVVVVVTVFGYLLKKIYI